jgi:hypothetical protein
MMAMITVQKTFASHEEASEYAAAYAQCMWGYDPLIRVNAVDGLWVVYITRQASCD